MREILLCISVLLVLWAIAAELILISGASSIDRAQSEKEKLINSQNFFTKNFSRALYFALENRPFIGVIGVALFFAVTFLGK